MSIFNGLPKIKNRRLETGGNVACSSSDLDYVVSLLTTFGLILINSQRLEHEIKATGEKLEESLKELKQKMDQIKILSGFLQICASCKKIRNDQGIGNSLNCTSSIIRKYNSATGSVPTALRNCMVTR